MKTKIYIEISSTNIYALQISIAVVNGMDYVISWNCKHIANAKIRNKINQICLSCGYEPVIICTPEELMED